MVGFDWINTEHVEKCLRIDIIVIKDDDYNTSWINVTINRKYGGNIITKNQKLVNTFCKWYQTIHFKHIYE